MDHPNFHIRHIARVGGYEKGIACHLLLDSASSVSTAVAAGSYKYGVYVLVVGYPASPGFPPPLACSPLQPLWDERSASFATVRQWRVSSTPTKSRPRLSLQSAWPSSPGVPPQGKILVVLQLGAGWEMESQKVGGVVAAAVA